MSVAKITIILAALLALVFIAVSPEGWLIKAILGAIVACQLSVWWWFFEKGRKN